MKRLTGCNGRDHEKIDEGSARSVATQRDATRVAAKDADVVLQPQHSRHLLSSESKYEPILSSKCPRNHRCRHFLPISNKP
jgi:hypothetical protein